MLGVEAISLPNSRLLDDVDDSESMPMFSLIFFFAPRCSPSPIWFKQVGVSTASITCLPWDSDSCIWLLLLDEVVVDDGVDED